MNATKTLKIGRNTYNWTHTLTLGVLGGAYRGGAVEDRALRTHLVICNGDTWVRNACRQNLDNMADEFSVTEEQARQRPTCPTCAKRWDALQTT